MTIIHYFLGFPPFRSGGLTKYAVDLMESQHENGHNVVALWPGTMKFFNKKVVIKKNRKVNGIENYEIINPLPVSLDEGIIDIDKYTKACDISVYMIFLKKIQPDVVHIHTLMGLHKEFIDASRKLKIRTVFTTHDYFGLCPKVTLYNNGKCCDDDHDCKDCVNCNSSALSVNKIRIMQSSLYRTFKDSYLVKSLRRKHRKEFFSETESVHLPDSDIDRKSVLYKKLRRFYVYMLSSIDFIHFNSTVAEQVYCRFFIPKNSRVVSITHKNIKKQEVKKNSEDKKKTILFLAPAKPYKGFNVLKEALDQLWNEGYYDFQLLVFSPVYNHSPYMVVKEDGYKQGELKEIMSSADILVAPSVWYETFGFTVLEALSYGVPVIVSDHVGAKDIVGQNGIIVKSGNSDQLKDAILSCDIKVNAQVKEWKDFLIECYGIYRSNI